MLLMVYFLEYSIITAYAQIIDEKSVDIDNGKEPVKFYVVINTCY